MTRFKSIIFHLNSTKLKLFFQKNAKFSSTRGSAPRPPLASGGWGLHPQTPKTAHPPLRIPGYAPDNMSVRGKLLRVRSF